MEIKFTKDDSELKEALEIALELKEYFTKEAITNMNKDFLENEMIIARDKSIDGFLCFGIKNNKYEIIWMAVKKDRQDRGIGKNLLDFLVQYLRDKNVKELYVKTLTPEDSYEPYRRTRKFYEKYRFKHLYIEKAAKKGWDNQVVMKLDI